MMRRGLGFPVRAAKTLLGSVALLSAGISQAGLILSQAVVDIDAKSQAAQDVELWNDSPDVSYVTAQPFEVLSPGQPAQHREEIVDPAVGGLLVTPQRLILQPGERKLVRIAAVVPRASTDRLYRVTIKPVAGPLNSGATAIKVLVGYDVLVIFRPANPTRKIVATKTAQSLTLRNDGNTNVEMYAGKQCDSSGADCKDLGAKRLYAGESWQQPLLRDGPIHYKVKLGQDSFNEDF